MIQRGDGVGLALEAFAEALVGNLDRDVAVQPGVARLVDLAHAARADGREDLQEKAQQNPQDAAAHYALAGAYFNTGQIPEAENELKRVLELQPQNTKARTELGASYLRQERGKEAQEEFAKLAAQDPNNVDAHAGMGMALAEQGNHETAIAEYETTLRLEPQASGVHYRMGISQAALKRYDDAIASYLKEREQTGDDADLETALADAYLAKGMTHEMQDARDRALQLRSGPRDDR